MHVESSVCKAIYSECKINLNKNSVNLVMNDKFNVNINVLMS